MPDAGQNYRLDDLKLRWEREPSSRLFLQLADEHRKLGQTLEAVTVLEKGLEHRPNDLSALVALGRCRLELDQVNEAAAALETVIARDPTHIVANKLLLDAYLQQGDPERAGARLETYRLLNSRDPELDHLEYRLERLRTDQPDEASTVVSEEFITEASVTEKGVAEESVESYELVPEDGASATDDAPVSEDTSRADLGSSVADSVPVPSSTNETFEVSPVTSTEPAFSGRPLKEIWSNPFPQSQDLPTPDLEALWRDRMSSSQRLQDPFEGLTQLDVDQHWAALAQEGIFSIRLSEAVVKSESAADDDRETSELQTSAELQPSAVVSDSTSDSSITSDADAVVETTEAVQVNAQVTDLMPSEELSPSRDLTLSKNLTQSPDLSPTSDLSLSTAEPASEEPDSEERELESAVDSADDSQEDADVASGWMAGVAALATAAATATVGLVDEDSETDESTSEPSSLEAAGAEDWELRAEDSETRADDSETRADDPEAQLDSNAMVEDDSVVSQEIEAEPVPAETPDLDAMLHTESDDLTPAEVMAADIEISDDAAAGVMLSESVVKDSVLEDSALGESPLSESASSVAEVAEEATPDSAVPSEPASATLADLYLQQGHQEEAQRIYRQVLEQDPGHGAALAGLAKLEGRAAPTARSLTAADLLAVRTKSGKIPEGLTAKKILVLDNYIKHLRAGQHVH